MKIKKKQSKYETQSDYYIFKGVSKKEYETMAKFQKINSIAFFSLVVCVILLFVRKEFVYLLFLITIPLSINHLGIQKYIKKFGRLQYGGLLLCIINKKEYIDVKEMSAEEI
jgi:hypothetical protein